MEETDAAEFMNAICESLSARGTCSRELVALEFNVQSANVRVLTRSDWHVEGYPELHDVLGKIGRDCVEHGINVRQLRRITFLEDEVAFEWMNAEGQREVYNYPLRPTLH
jgi:hypothetical protein